MKIVRGKIKELAIGFGLIFLLGVMGTSANAENTIRIGLLGPMKYMPGKHVLYGANLAIEEINEAGGIMIKGKKYKIAVTTADTNEILSLPDAVSAMERLITVDKVDFLVGAYNSEPVLAMQEVMADYKKIYICPGSSHVRQCERIAKNYNRYKYFFRCGPPNTVFMGQQLSHELMMVIEKVREELDVKKPRVALLCEKGLWAEENMKNGIAGVPKDEFEIVGHWSVSRTASDVTAEMSAIKAAKPHIILDVISGPVGIPIARNWGELKIPAVLVGADIPGVTLAHWQATNGMCNYEIVQTSIGRVEITEKTIPFYDKIVAKTKELPAYIAADSYDAIYILKDALERAGTTETEPVLVALEKTDFNGVTGRIKFFPKDHKWPHDLMWGPGKVTWVDAQWRDGELVTVWPDGKARLGEKGFEGLKYKGTKELELPPWMLKYWKAQK